MKLENEILREFNLQVKNEVLSELQEGPLCLKMNVDRAEYVAGLPGESLEDMIIVAGHDDNELVAELPEHLQKRLEICRVPGRNHVPGQDQHFAFQVDVGQGHQYIPPVPVEIIRKKITQDSQQHGVCLPAPRMLNASASITHVRPLVQRSIRIEWLFVVSSGFEQITNR